MHLRRPPLLHLCRPPLLHLCRTTAFVNTMRASNTAYAEFRALQIEQIEKNLAEQAEREGQPRQDVDTSAPAVEEEEVPDDEFKEKEARRPITQVLQVSRPVETRWNSTMFMIQR